MRSNRTIGIGLVGLGTVGAGVFKILRSQARAIEAKTGVRLMLRKICVQSVRKKRSVSVPAALLTDRVRDLIQDPSIDVLVELIGGLHPAENMIEKAFAAGKHVVTANKALLAERGQSIFKSAARYSRQIGIEASVCGGIPIIQSIEKGLVSDSIPQFLGIVNGTCNYILSAMSQQGIEFAEALEAAKARGYAEKNPGLDIDGTDSAHKLAILARLAFRSEIPFGAIHVEGIRFLSACDIEYARHLGYVIKLLAIGKKLKEGLQLRVHPTLLPLDHPLSGVRGVYNAVFVHADQAGDLLFYGRGAGSMPTASAVMSDIIAIAKRIGAESPARTGQAAEMPKTPVLSIEKITSKYYLRFQVKDRPGVLGKIAQTLGKHHISILSVHQKESHDPNSVPVIILTYEASEKNIGRALQEINAKKDIKEKTVMIRVEG